MLGAVDVCNLVRFLFLNASANARETGECLTQCSIDSLQEQVSALSESDVAEHQRKAAKMYEGMALIHESLGQHQQVLVAWPL